MSVRDAREVRSTACATSIIDEKTDRVDDVPRREQGSAREIEHPGSTSAPPQPADGVQRIDRGRESSRTTGDDNNG
jgi:hypothetical protein